MMSHCSTVLSKQIMSHMPFNCKNHFFISDMGITVPALMRNRYDTGGISCYYRKKKHSRHVLKEENEHSTVLS